MTNAVIEKALAQQPPEIRAISTGKIIQTLKERRQYFADDVMEYYRFLAEIVDVTASDKTELFDITRNDDGSILLKIFKISKEGETETKMYEHLFDPQDTKEIRLYAFGGADKFTVKGTNDKIKIRMIGGEGVDHFEYAGNSGDGGIVYDSVRENNKITGRVKNKKPNDTIVTEYDPSN